jgi:probable F420-dependent oxidoreductase
MRVGLALPHYDFSFPDGKPLSWDRLREVALKAEALGFDSIWISDHFYLELGRYGGPGGLHASIEPFTALAALAVETQRVRLGTLVACAPFRHVGILAKMATTIDLASGGRFDLGLGAGWYAGEFEAFGYPFPPVGERFSQMEEQVEALAGLFGEGPVDFDGSLVHLQQAFNRPRPAQPGGPPIWLGGKGGDRLLRLVARHAHGWNSVWKWTPEAFGARASRLRELCAEVERDPASVGLSVGLFSVLGEDAGDLALRWKAAQRWTPGGAMDDVSVEDFAEDTLTGTVESCIERLAAFASHGVGEAILSFGPLPFALFDDEQLELAGERLIPQAHAL